MHRIKALAPYISFGCIVVFIFGQHLFPAPDQLISQGDIHRSHYFFYSFFRWSLTSGFLPWWNPYTFGGSPFLANPSINPFYPVNWLLLLLPLNTGFAFHLAFHVFWAMTGMHLLLTRFVNKFASWFGAVAFGLSGVFTAHLFEGNYDVNAACSWLPWSFLAFVLAIQKTTKKQIIIAGITLSFHILAGYQTMTFFAMLAIGIYTCINALLQCSFRPFKATFFGVLIALGLTAVQMIPMQEFVSHTIRTYPKPYAWISYGSLPVSSLRLFIEPFVYGDQYSYNEGYIGYWEHAVFMGKSTLIFAVIAFCIMIFVFLTRRYKKNAFGKQMSFGITALILIIFGIWVSLGSNAPIDLQYLLWQYVPLYNYIRIPPRHLLLAVFGIAVLAAFGMQLIFAEKNTRMTILKIIVGAFLLWELIPFAKRFVVSQEIPEMRLDTYLTTVLPQKTTRLLPNFVVWYPPRRSLEFDSPLLYRYFSVSGYDVVIPKTYYQFFNAISNRDDFFDASMQVVVFDVYPQALSFLNIGNILTSYDNDQFRDVPQFKLVKEDASQFYRLYENTHPIPRFYLVETPTVLPNNEAVYSAIRNKTFDYSKTFVTSDKLVLQDNSKCTYKDAQVKTLSYTPNQIQLAVNNNCDSFLVSSENNYPGWRATVDGKDTPIITANLAFRAIWLPKGSHTVTFYYQPTIFLIGLCVSLTTIVIVTFFAVPKLYARSRK